MGLPAAGRKVLGKSAAQIFCKALPQIVEASIFYKNINQKALSKQVELIMDQEVIREELKRDLVAFVANGAILPRENGISQRPLKKGSVPFKSPEHLEVTMNLPYKGVLKGMGIPKGITLIVGGGYHGKSTLLNAIELGVYNHIAGDGANEHGYYNTWEEAFNAYEEYTKNWLSSHYKVNQCACGKYYFWAIQD